MRNEVKLFINDELVDFSNELSMPFVYQLEDVNNPSVIKNSFTKTITIVGTKQNNKIFGDIYNFDREQLYSSTYLTGAYFNPSYRTPFTIYSNGELIESGYMQLNSITLKDNIINYKITLYGGLGDFFYNLSYSEDSEQLSLSDLTYGVKDDSGNILDPEKEFDFNIDKDVVEKCWNNRYATGRLGDFINFVPSYNGVYEDFDNNKALINTNGCQAFTKTQETVDGKTYKIVNGYAMAEFDKEMTEWEIRSLRSYMQRPAIKLKKVIEACCNPINNGGYTVELDNTFFNSSNPYWENSYIALPMFGSLVSDSSGSLVSSGVTPELYGDYSYIGNNGTYNSAIGYYINPKGAGWVLDDYGYIDTKEMNYSSVYSCEVDFQLFFKANTTVDLYQSMLINGKSGNITYNDHPSYQSITAQIMVYADNNPFPVAYSDIYNLTNKLPNGKYSTYSVTTSAPFSNAPIVNVFGHFKYDANSKLHYFKSDSGSNTFRINVGNIPKSNYLRFCLYIERISDDGYGATNSRMWTSEYATAGKLDNTKAEGYWTVGVASDTSSVSATWDGSSIGSGFKVTKQLLLKTEKTPADYLLSYCKLFNLHFLKDISSKTIKIVTRDNYFIDEIVDWDNRIDKSKDIEIKPIIFDKKFYAMNLTGQDDNYYLKKYKNDYSINYGQKRLNTAYNFNTETQQLFDNNVFQNSVSVLDNSPYYRNFYNSSGVQIPAFAAEGFTYKLFAMENGEYKPTDIDTPSALDSTRTVKWNIKSGYDTIAKPAFFKLEDNKKSLCDITNTLLFYLGNKTPQDANGNTINYWLTDDISEMGLLNDGKPCHIYTENINDIFSQRIAYKLTSIPQFLRYNVDGNTVLNSWDFAVPKEAYIPNINYSDATTIYKRFWDSFYEDQLDINTKKVTCYVNLQGVVVNEDLLRKFYWFGNSLWILNKIDNYDINNYGTTKCEFIKVQEQYSYLKPLGF